MQRPKFARESLPSTAYCLNRFSTFFHASGFFPQVDLSRNFKLLIRHSFSFGWTESPWDFIDDDSRLNDIDSRFRFNDDDSRFNVNDSRFVLLDWGELGEFKSTRTDILSGFGVERILVRRQSKVIQFFVDNELFEHSFGGVAWRWIF